MSPYRCYQNWHTNNHMRWRQPELEELRKAAHVRGAHMETPIRIAPHLTIQDPLAAVGTVVLDCRPQVLPGAMDVSGTDLVEIRSMTRAGVLQPCEDELSIPASPPADVNHEVDSELEQVFVGSLPTMVTPVIDGTLRVPPAECPVIAPPAVSAFVIQPSMATSPVGPKFLSPGLSHPSPASVGVLSVPRTSPVVAVPEEFMLLNAAVTNQAQPEAGPSFTGDLAGGLFPAIPLTPCPATASRHGSHGFVYRGAVRHSPGSSAFRRLSTVATGHPGVSVSDDILRCGGRWTKFCTSIWGPAPRSTSAGVCRCSGIGMTNES